MKQIAVTGGKGGTGKSTVAILLANHLALDGKKVVLVDADVECPNDYLMTGQKLRSPVELFRESRPEIDKERCRKCGWCVTHCRAHAIFQVKNQWPMIDEELCTGCGLCWRLCPYGAIKVKKETTGEIFQNRIKEGLWLVTGRVKGVQKESAGLTVATREWAEKLAKKVKADVLIIDTAAGLHCGVIRSLWGVEKALAVTEPTSLGAHDLSLMLALLRELNVPAEVVLNMADIGLAGLVEKAAGKVPVSYRLAYSKELARAYAAGKLLEKDWWKEGKK